MSLTKQDIDELVEKLPRAVTDPTYLVFEEGGYYVAPSRVRRALYLAAGLTAEGERKPERVRCWHVINPEYPEHSHFWADPAPAFPRSYRLTPGWFVPDGAA